MLHNTTLAHRVENVTPVSVVKITTFLKIIHHSKKKNVENIRFEKTCFGIRENMLRENMFRENMHPP